jgi:hypothetical protein
LSVFSTQVGAKRYDLGALGRRRANAVFSEIRSADRHDAIVWAMDLGPLARGDGDPAEFVRALVRRLDDDVAARLLRLRSVHT